MRLQNKIVKATIWDTAGQERFRTLTSSYYRGAHGVLLVYDVTRPETFQHLNAWLSEIEMYSPAGGKHVVKLLVGNKSDLEADRAVSTKEGEEWARSKGMLFLESSAKSGEAVKSVFEEVVSKVLESPALLASCKPLGLNATDHTVAAWWGSVHAHAGSLPSLGMHHSLTLLSLLPLASRSPNGLYLRRMLQKYTDGKGRRTIWSTPPGRGH